MAVRSTVPRAEGELVLIVAWRKRSASALRRAAAGRRESSPRCIPNERGTVELREVGRLLPLDTRMVASSSVPLRVERELSRLEARRERSYVVGEVLRVGDVVVDERPVPV